MSKILEINNLSVEFISKRGATQALKGISLYVNQGETLGIVGESGSGKSVTALSVMRLLPMPPGRVTGGEIWYPPPPGPTPAGEGGSHSVYAATSRSFKGGFGGGGGGRVDLLTLPDAQLRQFRGSEIAMIFQEPMSSLNPVFRCGHQVTEAIQLHQKISFEAARMQALKLFKRVRLPDPVRIFEAYPHQISGGQKQRVMIAMAMSCQPSILIADEPTTALDVTVQKTILDLMRELRDEAGLSMMFISHDLGVISEICDRVVVMHQGEIVEQGPVAQILQAPRHPYTQGLVACRPSLKHKLHRLPTIADFFENNNFEARVITAQETTARRSVLYQQQPLLDVRHLQVRYPSKKNWLGQPVEWIIAVDDVSFQVFPGETFGLAGESGCGKTTLGRAIARLQPADAGEVIYTPPTTNNQQLRTNNQELNPNNLLALRDDEMRPLRREIQVIFQDPYGSLNPKITIGAAIMEPMAVHSLHDNARQRKEKAIELLETVGLEAAHFQRYRSEFSGGQRQRICIARALALEPKLLICDECVSALDVSVQATILNLLMDLQERFGLTYLFISHDLSVVKQMCDRLMIMNQGKIEVLGFPEEIYDNPQHEYVRKLIEAIPGQRK